MIFSVRPIQTVLVFLLGIIFGSFINAYIFRLHEKNNKKYKKSNLSILSGRSICPKCQHVLSVSELIPLFGWIYLKGKCKNCHKSISIQYPIVELLTGLLFVFSYKYWPYGFSELRTTIFGLWLLLLVTFIVLSVYDFKWMILPNILVKYSTLIGVLLIILLAIDQRSPKLLIESLISGIILFIFFYGLFVFSKGMWIGGGDVKISFLLGILAMTPVNCFLLVFIASLLGCIYSVPIIFFKNLELNSKIPFGPFLIISTVIVFFYATDLLNWYKTLVF